MRLADPQRDHHRPTDAEDQLDPRAQLILERMARVAYVLDCHRQAIAKHSRHLAELRTELERLEGRR